MSSTNTPAPYAFEDEPVSAASVHLPVVIVGGGLAGLNCARLLSREGVRCVVLEAASRVGGRVATDVVDGFTIDRGFQVLFTAYPALRRALGGRLDQLDLRVFDNGAAVVTPQGPEFLRPPIHHPEYAVSALVNPLLTWRDRLQLARLGASVWASPWDGTREVRGIRRTVAEEFAAWGFSTRFIESFLRPFFGGLSLDPSLEQTSADVFRFVFKMLVQGRAGLPSRGMQAIPEALQQTLPAGTVRTEADVVELTREAESGEVTGARLASGEVVEGRAVVIATEGDAAEELTGIHGLPAPRLGCTTVYLAGRERLYRQKLVALNARQATERYVNEAALLTNVAPEYAPEGWHLLAATVVGTTNEPDDVVDEQVRADLQHWWPQVDLKGWRTVDVARVPRALMSQPPGFFDSLKGPRTHARGLYLGGEWTQDSSINGALRAGEQAARAVLADLEGRILSVE